MARILFLYVPAFPMGVRHPAQRRYVPAHAEFALILPTSRNNHPDPINVPCATYNKSPRSVEVAFATTTDLLHQIFLVSGPCRKIAPQHLRRRLRQHRPPSRRYQHRTLLCNTKMPRLLQLLSRTQKGRKPQRFRCFWPIHAPNYGS